MKSLYSFVLFMGVTGLLVLQISVQPAHSQNRSDLASLVNPMVGTDGGGDTFPGAVTPFGMVQFTPNLENNGYYYTDSHMHGFAMNSMSGDGGADEGQILMTATSGPVKIDRTDTDFTFDHQHERASAGCYQVLMQPWGITAELTASTHCGMARFTFPPGKQNNILLPVSYANTPTTSCHIHYADDQTVTGDVASESFGGMRHSVSVYFIMSFSKPFDSHGTWTDKTMTDGSADAAQNDKTTVIGFYGSYAASARPQSVVVRIGISYVDLNGAIANLRAEMPAGADSLQFDRARMSAAEAWDRELSLVDVQGGTLTHRRIFYTALYHSLIAPEIFDDVDGRYTGFDGRIHTVPPGHRHFYATFSGWDIYRSEFPLLGIIEPERAQDMAQSIVEMAKQLGYIDRWPQLNQPTTIMNGDPLTLCLTNLWNAGLHHFDMESAYPYMWKQAQPGDPHAHIDVYQGFDEERGGVTLNPDCSVSTALEYDLSFAALGHLAEALNKPDDATYLYGRAYQYREMYNPASGYLQGKTKTGIWDGTFGGYTEGNKDIYLWFVPEDVQGLVDLMGGASAFDRRLDSFFENQQYDPTNEPDLQAPFLYDYIDRPWKTQHIAAETADRCFTDTPGGLAGGGNDDLGTMSAWYILSQLGFYPVDPGTPTLEICTPRFPKAILSLDGSPSGRQFVVEAADAAPANEYIQSATLNGKPLTKPWFDESSILSGGAWSVQVGPSPNLSFASSPYDRPYSLSTGFLHTPQNPLLQPIAPTGKDQGESWTYTTDGPGEDWYRPQFDDTRWKIGIAGFGTEDVGVVPRTAWSKDDIWMRREFQLPAGFHAPAIVAYHDQDMDVYVNGVLAAHVSGWTHAYDVMPISSAAFATLQAGPNLLAVHVHHPGEGRHFADIGIYEQLWPDSEK